MATLNLSLRTQNTLLRNLPPNELALLLAEAEPVLLPKRMVLTRPHVPFEHVHFLESGVASVVTVSPNGNSVEAGIYGWDGMGPAAAVLGIDQSPQQCIMQVAGSGLRIPLASFWAALDHSPVLRKRLGFYVHAFAMQTAYTALSNAVHIVEQRLARWLLMCHDRCEGDVVDMTHDFLSIMLAVRRPSVTVALHILEGHRLIRNDRGTILIRSREALEAFAADAYGEPEAEYQRLLGPLFPLPRAS